MVAGAIGVHSLSVLIHVAEVHRHVIGNVTVHVLNMEEILARGTRMRLSRAILTYVQVRSNSSFVTDIQTEHNIACIPQIKYFRLRLGIITNYVTVMITNYA